MSYVRLGGLHDKADPHEEAINGVPELHDSPCEKTKVNQHQAPGPDGKGHAHKSRATLTGSR